MNPTDTLKQAAQALRTLNRAESYTNIEALAAALEAMAAQEPVAHMYPSDLEKFQTSETFAHAYSVAVGCPGENSVPLYAAPSATPEPRALNVDDLAQEIRRVDGEHELGAGKFAEALMPFLRKHAATPEHDAKVMDAAEKLSACPHAAPFRYCFRCRVSPCPIGIKSEGIDYAD